ncbi:MAG: hypothetical protein QGD90_07820 [Candidatus Hydrogenedentes bacterium]|nr:hypothetical protein [Candidatus Hydrogenedentota bacterium]
MLTVYTPNEVAGLLDFDLGIVTEMAETGRLSGFEVDGEWRITHEALVVDLRRMQASRARSKPLPPASLGGEPWSAAPSPDAEAPSPHEAHQLEESFQLNIEIENNTSFSGDFHLRLLAEGDNDKWKNFEGTACDLRDATVTIQGHLSPGEVIPLFNGILHGNVGDRLFVTVPQQDGIDVPIEKVYVLHADTGIKLLLTQSGIFKKRNALQFQRL